MILHDSDLANLLTLAIDAAKRAGRVINSFSGTTIAVEAKEAGVSPASQVVTEADYASQEIILEVLQSTCVEYDIALLTEESPDDGSRLEKDYFWCIDPLDGTLPFTEGVSGYSVSIALVTRCGIPVIGVVFDPVTETLYHAVKGGGAFKNKKTFNQNVIKDNNSVLTLICDRSFKTHRLFNSTVSQLEKVAQNNGCTGVEVIGHGGAAMNACWVFENAPACYIKYPKSEDGGGSLWDYAATACIVTELGFLVSDIEGNSLALNNPNSTFMNKHGVVYASDEALITKWVKALATSCY